MTPGHFRDHDALHQSLGDDRDLDLVWPLASPFGAGQNFDTSWPTAVVTSLSSSLLS